VDNWGNLLIIEPKTSGLQRILFPWAFHPSALGTSIFKEILVVENSKWWNFINGRYRIWHSIDFGFHLLL